MTVREREPVPSACSAFALPDCTLWIIAISAIAEELRSLRSGRFLSVTKIRQAHGVGGLLKLIKAEHPIPLLPSVISGCGHCRAQAFRRTACATRGENI